MFALEKLNLNELAILRNAIYTKHGYIFSKQEYNEYFQKLDWYTPISQDIELKLTNTDNNNIKKITDLEKRLKKIRI
ncbi:YARHG domain-containing protein [Wukongibacter sp. M2B1]|uniref:YARHG domain-containing protein n=1 Tax=Wukongibacter sp. M2B1 TaxID=3088895 RepID=UPI003D79E292